MQALNILAGPLRWANFWTAELAGNRPTCEQVENQVVTVAGQNKCLFTKNAVVEVQAVPTRAYSAKTWLDTSTVAG
jgi:hypothetical protein